MSRGSGADATGQRQQLMTQESRPVRAFIAIPLPEAIRLRIASLQREWQSAVPGGAIRWTPVEQIHLTLRFLGDVPLHATHALQGGLQRACDAVSAFELSAAGNGCFPGIRRPRVLWIGVGGALDALSRLQERVLRETADWGEREDREFRAHLTYGRVKNTSPSITREIARYAQGVACGELGRWRVDAVCLMRSELAPAGATHRELTKCPLRGSTY